MKELSFLVKPASSMCNMSCRYCFYADVSRRRETASYGLMTHDVAKRLITAAAEDVRPADRVIFAFQGGEPTLSGIGFYKYFFETARELLPKNPVSFSLQTNGLALDEAWCSLFREYNVLVGLSIDGGPQFHNAYRLDPAGHGTYGRVRASMQLMKRCGVMFNVLCVLTAQAARHPSAIWSWLKKEGVEYVQFVPCLNELEPHAGAPWAVAPSRLCSFYRQLFPLWRKHLEEGHFLSVKLFDDLVNQYLLGQVTACGMAGRCTIQYVVESNGDVFPCDFYVLDQYRLGSILDSRPSELYPHGQAFLSDGQGHTEQEPCRSCPYRDTCGGGCKRQRDSMYIENGVCQYAMLLDELLPPLLAFARRRVTAGGNGTAAWQNRFIHETGGTM